MKKLDIIYEDKNLLVINKPTKLLTISTLKEKEHTLYQSASQYVKKQYPKNKVFIVNRLDKDTSGIVVFAKNETLKKELQESWNDITKREYYAIVEGKMSNQKGTLKNYLKEEDTFYVHSSKDGKLAITHYEVLGYKNKYTLLKIKIDTGRKNQIRVQLSEIGHPIIGDKKYHSKHNPIGRLGLHAKVLDIKIKKKNYHFETKLPKEMEDYFGTITKNY